MKRLIMLAVVALGCISLIVNAQTADDERYVGTFPAPEFPTELEWLNVDNPLTMAGLQGKIVVFDFWTYGCINCIHMLPVYEQLGEKYPNEIVIIGVHSAKFANEGATDNIRQIVQRYDIQHPVINDKDFVFWQLYGINAWPTTVVVDPRGNVIASESGEIPFEVLDQYLSSMIAYYDSLGLNDIDRTPLALALEGAGDPGTPLLFPGDVFADVAGNRLFIADSNHNRIVIADLMTYEVLDIIGGAGHALVDGDYATAQFNKPQGIAARDNMLYVADTNNHAIRAVNLTDKTVTTIAGNGMMSSTLAIFGQEADGLLQRPLRSPWDVTFGASPDILYIAMAGMHQIHTLDLARGVEFASIGTGAEAQLNGDFAISALAQPSGITVVNNTLYIADSESSTIRAADLDTQTLQVAAGTMEDNLFDFADVDGVAGVSRLQHALGVASNDDGSVIYVADTYNSKIKQLDPTTNTITTLLGLGGEGGFVDGDAAIAQFDEPSGMSFAAGKLYIADTNNHSIRVLDAATSTVTTLVFPNIERLITDTPVTVIGGNQSANARVATDAVTLPPGEQTLTLALTLPQGYKINPLTDSLLTATSADVTVASAPVTPLKITETTLAVPLTVTEGTTSLALEMSLFYCEATEESVCLIALVTLDVPLSVAVGAPDDAAIAYTVVLPEEYR